MAAGRRRAKKPAAEPTEAPSVDSELPPEPVDVAKEEPVAEPAKAPEPRFFVSHGKAVGTHRGVVDHNTKPASGIPGQVFPCDVPGGVERLRELVGAGYVIER